MNSESNETTTSGEGSCHIPVMPGEIVEFGKPAPGEVWIDGTAGGGGHTRLLAKHVDDLGGRVLALDRDPTAIERLSELPSNVVPLHSSYHLSRDVLEDLEVPSVDGILLDLGLSSDQLADPERGFSFQSAGELDMRFDASSGNPVREWIQHVDEKTLADTIYQYGEERFSRRIARRIVEERRKRPIRTAEQLRELIYQAIPGARRSTKGTRRHGRIDPATRTFQALRIAVNEELTILESALQSLPDILSPCGRLLIISFHSLEDRIVKHALRADDRLTVVTKKPVQATDEEIALNPRSRSAKLRVATRNPQA